MTPEPVLARALTDALLAGAWTRRAMVERLAEALGSRLRGLSDLADAALRAFPAPPLDRPEELESMVRGLLDRFFDTLPGTDDAPRVHRWFLPAFTSAPGRWPVRRFDTIGDLATFLSLSPAELDWFADLRGFDLRRGDSALRHYTFRWVPKRSGGERLLAAPKACLKRIQRSILTYVLDRVPPHDAAHGFRAGRSALTHAQAHVGAGTVLHFDLRDFFGTVPQPLVRAIFHSLGYRRDVARVLAGLCLVRVPDDVARTRPEAALLRRTVLPQGAPTSPTLANLAAFGLDVRLTALAKSLDATYTRYADDLVLSGPARLASRSGEVLALVQQIAAGEGFDLQRRKTRVQSRGGRQRVTGVVVNERPNVAREDYDALKALLHNCVRHGPGSQNRRRIPAFRDHLFGRVSWVASIHPARGARLRALFERIDWTGSGSET